MEAAHDSLPLVEGRLLLTSKNRCSKVKEKVYLCLVSLLLSYRCASPADHTLYPCSLLLFHLFTFEKSFPFTYIISAESCRFTAIYSLIMRGAINDQKNLNDYPNHVNHNVYLFGREHSERM